MVTLRHRDGVPVSRVDDVFKSALTSEKLWSKVSTISLTKMAQLAPTVERIAPRPGYLVYVETANLSRRLNTMQPVVYSAFDAATHLQVARIYLTNTYASAVDFLEFAIKKFPFPVAQIRTPAESPFYVIKNLPAQQRVSDYLRAQGVVHSIMNTPSRDELFSVLTKLSFGSIAAASIDGFPWQKIMREFINYQFFHNNDRTFPSLQGRTPLQKLKSFKGFEHVHSFDPFAIEAGRV